MMRVKDVALVLIFACVAQQFLQVDSVKDKQRRGRAQPGEKDRKSGPKASGGTGVRTFSKKDETRCTWVAAGEGDGIILGVTCTNGVKSFECKYVAKPTSCQQYSSNTKAYWKQIDRSLKKQKSLCRDSTARVKAGMCRSAPAEAHFRLMVTRSSSGVSSAPPGSPPGSPPCPDRVDKLKRAEEYCTSTWFSLCTFLFLMVENDECA